MTDAPSSVMLLSYYDLLISGIEYRQVGFSFLDCKASLPRYFYFIHYLPLLPLSISFSFSYPGPSFFLLPIYQNSKSYFTGVIPDIPLLPFPSPRLTMQNLPPLLSPISSPPRLNQPIQRDPRLRKTYRIRAQNKEEETLKLLCLANKQIRSLNKDRKILEDQLDAILLLQGESQHTEACRKVVGLRLKSDSDLEAAEYKKDKLNRKLKVIRQVLHSFKEPAPVPPHSVPTPPPTPSPKISPPQGPSTLPPLPPLLCHPPPSLPPFLSLIHI